MSMPFRTLLRLSAASLMVAGMGAAQAANLGFLHDTPVSYLSQPDIDSIQKAVRAALDTKQDGESANWSNAGSRNTVKIDATITPTRTETDGDRTCRTEDVVLNAKGQTMTLRPRYCRTGKGAWVYQKTH